MAGLLADGARGLALDALDQAVGQQGGCHHRPLDFPSRAAERRSRAPPPSADAPDCSQALAFCGLPWIYHPYIWWPQHIVSHHQYTNDDALDVDLHHLRPARLHPGCATDESASGFNFIFKGYFSTMGMAVLWPLRDLQARAPSAAHPDRHRARISLRATALSGASYSRPLRRRSRPSAISNEPVGQ